MAGTSIWRRALRDGIAGAVVTTGLITGSMAAANADPSAAPTPAPTQAPASQAPTISISGGVQAPATATSGAASGTAASGTGAAASGDVLDQLAEQYAVGSGGGQLSNLLKMSLKLRAMGFKPSKANMAEIADAMAYRPNQIPLIGALKDTVAYQQKIRAQMEILQQYQKQQGANSAVMGAGQMPGDSNPGALQPIPAAPGS